MSAPPLCGLALAPTTWSLLCADALESQGVDARISEVGCIGLCYAEPLLDVQLPGGSRVFYGNFDPERAGEVVSAHVAGGQPVEELALGYLAPEDAGDDFVPPQRLRNLALHPMRAWENRIALRNAGNIDPLDIYQYIATGGYRALNRALLEMTPQDALQQVNESGLRGRGGAAFPTAHQVAGSLPEIRRATNTCSATARRVTPAPSTTRRSWRATPIRW